MADGPDEEKIPSGSAGVLEVFDTIDRPGDAFAKGPFTQVGTFAVGSEDKPGKRVPKAGAYAKAGYGKARAEYSIFEAEAKGPNVSAETTIAPLNAAAFVKAELASASAAAGPVKVKVGLAADTGVSVGPTWVEAKVLGTGVSIGTKLGVSVFGTGVECCIS